MEEYRELGGYTHLAALEKLYTEIVGKDPREQFRLERRR